MKDVDVLGETVRDHGLAHTPGLVPHALCDALVAAWTAEVAPFEGLLRRQHNLREEVHLRSEDGFVVNPVFGVHDQERFPGFAAAAREVVGGTKLRACADAVLGAKASWLQSAFFDSGLGTMPHRDDPPYAEDGAMIGAWVALEDIALEAGPFLLWPGSRDWQDDELDALGRSVRTKLGDGAEDLEAAAAYHARLAQLLEGKAPLVCTVAKGDVVWWDRRVVHGAMTPTVGAGRSRRSLVLHFIPE